MDEPEDYSKMMRGLDLIDFYVLPHLYSTI